MHKLLKHVRNFLRNPWTIGICTILIASAINSFLENVNIFQSIIKVFLSIISFKIPTWVLVLGVGGYHILNKFFLKPVNTIPKPEWISYNKEKHNGILYKWDYQINNDKYEPSEIIPICDDCFCPLTEREFPIGWSHFGGEESYSYCPKCLKRFMHVDQDVLDDIEKIIKHNIQSGEYLSII